MCSVRALVGVLDKRKRRAADGEQRTWSLDVDDLIVLPRPLLMGGVSDVGKGKAASQAFQSGTKTPIVITVFQPSHYVTRSHSISSSSGNCRPSTFNPPPVPFYLVTSESSGGPQATRMVTALLGYG